MPTPVASSIASNDREQTSAVSGQALWVLIGVSTLLRLLWAATLGAAVDEPYYIQYIVHPAWSYFDHPPMVAFVGMPGVLLAGDVYSLFGLRVGFIGLFAGSTWLLARLTTRYYGPRAGLLAALALNVSGYFGMAVGTMAFPDGPLLFFWLLTIDRLAVALDDPRRWSTWAWVGIAWGGAMLSKYHAVLLPVGAVLYLLLQPRARRCLRLPGPYLAVTIGLLLFAPVFGWNATHGWASLLFQGGRASASTGFRPDHLVAALGAEALYFFPWLWIGLVGILVQLAWRGIRDWDDGETFLVSQAVPALALFHAVASFDRIMPYWPLFGFVSLLPLLGRAWANGLETRPIAARRWLATVIAIPVVLAALISTQAKFGVFGDSQGRLLGVISPHDDPTVDLIGWDQLAVELEQRGLLAEPNTFLFTDSWNRSARLALAVRGKAPVACYELAPRSFNFWSRPEDWVGRDGIFVEADPRPGQRARYSQFFRRYEPLGPARVVRRGAVIREFQLYRGTYQTWPFPFDGRLRSQTAARARTDSTTPTLTR